MTRLSFLALLLMMGTAMAGDRVPCWQVKAFLAAHGGDRPAARLAARARGYSESEIAEAERRCFR